MQFSPVPKTGKLLLNNSVNMNLKIDQAKRAPIIHFRAKFKIPVPGPGVHFFIPASPYTL
jgi:hypothetical protein